MVAEEVIITLSGGAPWGFRLQGGAEHQKPLQVAKVRKRSKACRAGLQEADELVSINDQPCGTLSHAQAMNLIDSSPGILHIRVKRAPVGFQSVVLVTRAPSPRIDKEYRAALRAMSPTQPQHAPVREVHRSRSSLTSGLTSPPGSEAYYGETDSDADVAGYERQRRQKRRSPSNSVPAKPTGRASPEGGETSEMSGYDSAPDAHIYHPILEGRKANGGGGNGLPGVARREVVYQPPGPGMWSSQTSTETSSIISSADDQGPRDGVQEDDSGFLEPANVPLVSPERAKEALMLGSRSQLVPMVGPLSKPVDEELSKTYMEKAKQAKLNRGDTAQDKNVKEAKSKCRTIASLLTDAPNPHSKGVLMFKKRRQRSKKYTLTSFGSVDEDRCHDSQEEDGVFPGSESEFDEDGFSSVPDPTWDSDYIDMLEKRATAGTEGRGDGAEDAPSPGLSDISGKGAQLFEQQRKRAVEHAKKIEAAQQQVSPQPQVQEQPEIHQVSTVMSPQMHAHQPQPMMSSGPPMMSSGPPMMSSGPPMMSSGPPMMSSGPPMMSSGPPMMSSGQLGVQQVSQPVTSPAKAPVYTINLMASPPVAPKPSTAPITVLGTPEPPSETPLPEQPASSVLNRTARPFTPGFISIRASTAPVPFRPPVTKTSQRPASAAVMAPFPTTSEVSVHVPPPMSQLPSVPPSVIPPHGPPSMPLAPEIPAAPYQPVFSTSAQTLQAAPPITAVHQAQLVTIPPLSVHTIPTAPQVPMPPPSLPPMPQTVPSALAPPVATAVPQMTHVPVVPVSVVSQAEPVPPTPVPGSAGRTGILLDSMRRGGKPKPMFTVPEVKKHSPNPELLTMVQNLDERSTRQRYGQSSEAYAEEIQDQSADSDRHPPPVAPKPKVIHETTPILQAEGKGAQLFAKRQSRMGMYVVDTPPETPYQQEVAFHSSAQSGQPLMNPDLSSQWKYTPNVRAPPPIGYNPLLAPTIPSGPQRDARTESQVRAAPHRDGIKALDFMRRQPYQLNAAMFNYGGSVSNLSALPSYQAQRQQQGGDYGIVGSSLTTPKQIPVKTARVYEIKRFSTPTPMSAPSLTPKVIAPRSATTLGDRITRSGTTSPPAVAPFSHPQAPVSSAAPPAAAPLPPAGLPRLPTFSAPGVPNPVPPSVPTPYTPVSYSSGLQSAKQFQSAPELSILASLPPLKSTTVQAPKPRFVATKGGVQPRVWRPGAM
ncbi:synaptopodin 2-like protein [Periophthalmus magnuspinnatus]|uniref:synaptopodin 2-like protein n=1 Tax=Periophthalmus magnuspinnatus TaxID=409849 RepID=UPI00145B740D|nr:synaptopodin 2-like protein [Periophthalmus magnuspinnatus]